MNLQPHVSSRCPLRLECAVYPNGKKTTKLVASKDECAKLHGHIVEWALHVRSVIGERESCWQASDRRL